MTTITTATAFTMLAITALKPAEDMGVPAFELWIAIWNNRGRGEVMLGAPTLDALGERWEQITSSDFDPTRAQHVVIAEALKVEVSHV